MANPWNLDPPQPEGLGGQKPIPSVGERGVIIVWTVTLIAFLGVLYVR